VPLLVVARDRLAPKRHPLLEPSSQPGDQRDALILFCLQEVEQLPLAVEIGQGLATEQLHELFPEQRAIDAVLEVLFSRREVVGVFRGHALQASQNVAGGLNVVEGGRPGGWVGVRVDVEASAGKSSSTARRDDMLDAGTVWLRVCTMSAC